MNIEQLKNLIAQGENPQTEFKSNVPKGEVLARIIVRIANNGGGNIIFGVDDENKITGVNYDDVKSVCNKAKSYIVGAVDIKHDIQMIDGRNIVITHVNGSSSNLRFSEIPLDNHSIFDSIDPSFPNWFDWSTSKIPDLSPSTIHNEFSDKDIKPCFDVDVIADAFADLIKSTSSDRDNICILGVFGKWGRGKTFFMNQVKKSIKQSEDTDCFDFVSFNAWKYQSTPEIWAHLIHTLKEHRSWWWKVLNFVICWTTLQVISEIALIVVAIIMGKNAFEPSDSVILKFFEDKIPAIAIEGVVVLGAILNLCDLIVKMFRFRKTRYNATEYLGDQHASENELNKILSRWNWFHMVNQKYYCDCRHIPTYPKKNPRKVVLVVEDVDRCESNKMISVLESLKLILENPKIARHLIVVISIDSDLLIHAIETKFSDVADSNKTAIERMNKLFLAGISLPKISKEDIKKYVEALGDLCKTKQSSRNRLNGELSGLYPNEEEQESNNGTNSTAKGTVQVMEEAESIEIIKEALFDKLKDGLYSRLTPRQIKILFYRMLLANNLFVRMDETLSKDTLKYIVDFSFNFEQNEKLGTTKENIIREMVVSYPVGTKAEYKPTTE